MAKGNKIEPGYGPILMDEEDVARQAAQQELHYEGGDVVQSTADDDQNGNLFQKFAAEFPHIERAELAEIAQFFRENMVRRGASGGNPLGVQVALLDLLAQFIECGLKNNVLENLLICWVLNNRHVDDLMGNQTPADWWRASGKSKYMCYKLAESIRKKLGLPRRDDQRSDKTRAKQSAKRKAGLRAGTIPDYER